MKTVEIYTEIQKWFNYDNYLEIEFCTLKAFHKEFQVRKSILDSIEFFGEGDVYFERILAGKPVISKEIDINNHLTESQTHIRQVTFAHIENLKRSLEMLSQESFNKGSGKLKKEVKELPIAMSMRSVVIGKNESRVYTFFDLESSSDDEIIGSLRTLLPVWRKEYGITGKKQEVFGLGRIIKLVDYRIIPMMDLLMWAKLKDIPLSNTILSRVLYPKLTDEVRGEEQIKDTDRPIAEKALSGETSKNIENYINKNSHLIDVKLTELKKML
ncbi:DUF6387 family protein [Erwinia mallotivora]|uniref:Uncharacterized protein n=1 Tax=Erwinia mallotivora TaxID=69222 RepID=A0A014N7I0_9GAMM|nr:DUF6387 family protein [Erwinia mallotivora]EXU75353.1 hypothetical protein BG55_11525 [Erwinia mallotivora]